MNQPVKQTADEWAEQQVRVVLLRCAIQALDVVRGIDWLREVGALPQKEGKDGPSLGAQTGRS